jgi:uncharacterized protein (TIGR02284 family)
MSTDKEVTKELMETLEDGRLGYEKAAEKLRNEHGEIASQLSAASQKRSEMYAELKTIASKYGDALEESGSVAAAVHRGWLALKDAVASDSAEAVLNAAITGENHSIEQYEEALAGDVSSEFRPVLQRQLVVLKNSLASLERSAVDAKG